MGVQCLPQISVVVFSVILVCEFLPSALLRFSMSCCELKFLTMLEVGYDLQSTTGSMTGVTISGHFGFHRTLCDYATLWVGHRVWQIKCSVDCSSINIYRI